MSEDMSEVGGRYHRKWLQAVKTGGSLKGGQWVSKHMQVFVDAFRCLRRVDRCFKHELMSC